jgi:hypothetical protein
MFGAGVFLAAVVLLAVVLPAIVLGTTLRAIGRGFGNGTFAAKLGVANAVRPMANAKLVTSAVDEAVDRTVDRKLAARAGRVTAFLGGESSIAQAANLFN